MPRFVPVTVIVHKPKTDEGKLLLSKKVSEVHAQTVINQIKRLEIPQSQKIRLLDAVIEARKKKGKRETR